MDAPPCFDRAGIEALARELCGVAATATALPSERDQNFLLAIDGEPRLVFKVAAADEDRGFLAAQQRTMQHVAARSALTPRVAALRGGGMLAEVTAPDGRRHLAWAVSVVPGAPLARLAYRSPALWHGLGAAAAELAVALAGFDDPALHRDFHWDLAHGRAVVARHRGLVGDAALGAAIDAVIHQFDDHTQPVLPDLPRGAIHGDLNDHNVLVSDLVADAAPGDRFARGQRVSGVVDFGDMVHGIVIGDLAIAAAYAMLDAADPLSVLWQLVRGYRGVRAPSEAELHAVFGLAMLRLATSACVAAYQQRQQPGNDYLGVSQGALGRTLPRLARIPFGIAAATARSACDLEPHATSARVQAWLGERTATFAPVLGADLELRDERSEETGGGDPDRSAGGAGGSAPRGIDERSEETGGGDPDRSAGGAGGSAPRGINERSEETGGGDPDRSAGGAGGSAPRGINERSEETGGGDPDRSAGGAGGSAPRGINERSEETGGGDPDRSAGGAGGSAPRGINPPLVLDLGIAGPLVSGDDADNAEPPFTARLDAAMRAAGARVAVGRYAEPRLLYPTPGFAAGDGTLAERRTVHLGLDLFAAAGTPVHAPLDGVVHFADEQTVHLDYGGVLVLRHATDDGTAFFTLYGHLRRSSFVHLAVGRRVARGEPIAELGAPEHNGGWTPHLHLQIICDLLGFGSEFPGVATASRRDVWCSVSPDPNLLVGIPAARLAPPARPLAETQARRRAKIGGSVRVAYRRPLRIVRGFRQYLYDDDGRRYLDAYNNVPHVGHCHPRVAAAAAAQIAVLNTNTRYLHDGLADYAERLTATLPRPLDVCFLVSSASEANELAIRLARTATGRRDLVVQDAAYHGNTTTLIDASPYKHAGPGGAGAPDWVHVAPLPDDYRGAHKRGDSGLGAGAAYAAELARIVDAVRARGRAIAGLLAETCPSVGGQIIPPPGYLAAAYRAVRAAGGLCIADEVQTGLGRIGSHTWAFEAHGVVPDLVVMGKPLGNGHPLAAVVTTRAIADAFDNGMEYFSTFGGNPVSCAIGSAVLDVLRDEALQTHAARIGDALLGELRDLAGRHALIGDVRGAGLFLGIELVGDRETLAPATAEAGYVVERMRDEGVLIGSDGPCHNVLKIRPPMPFDAGDAARLVETLDRVLGELA